MIKESILNSFKLYVFDDKAISYIKKKISWEIPFFLLFSILVIQALLDLVFLLMTQYSYEELIFLLLTIPIGVFSLFLTGLIIHLLLKIFGSQENYFETLKIYTSLALLPSIITTILFFPTRFFPIEEDLPTSLLVVFSIFLLVTAFIIVYYAVVAVRTYAISHKLSYLKTFLALIVVPIVLVVLFFATIAIIAFLFYAGI